MDFSLTTLYVLPSGSLVADGFKRENLQPTQFGIFNSRYRAVTTANDAAKSPHIVFGQGRIENVPGLTSKYSDKISRGSLIEWYKTNGSPTAKHQITYAGFDGVDNTKTLKAGCDEVYSLTIRGRSLYIDTGFAYGLTRTVTVMTPCCEDCGDNCEVIDPRWLANAFAAKINEEPLLSKFYVATPVFECETPADDPDVIDVVTYCVSYCDNGDSGALAAVQAQYPDSVITLKERVGSISTYQLTLPAADPAPANVLVTLPVRLAVCDVCPATYTLQGESEQYIIETPLDGSEDLNSAADRQTFANAVKATYVVPSTFNGATGVDPVTDQITLASTAGLTTGEAVVFSNGGGTSPTGLTSGTTYYVIVVDGTNVQLATTRANAIAGTEIDITADGVGAAQTLTVASTATFLENKGGSATILITVDANQAELTPVLADIVTLLGDQEALCLPPAGTSVAWAACDTGFQVARTLSLTVTDDCASDLADVQAHYPTYTVTLEESANCNSRYELVQYSDTVQEDCDFSVPPVFVDIQPYKGIEWTVVDPVLTGADCVAGVKIEGRPLDKYGNPCDPIAFPYEYDKLTFEVFAYKGAPTSQDFLTYDRCDNIPITTTQRSTYVTGSGDEIFELEKRYHSYQTTGVAKHIYHNATWNGGFVRYSDPGKFYDTYVLKFKSPDLNTWDNVSRQDESVIIAVPIGTGGALESFILGYFGPEKFTAGVLSV
jgi:hypothetical protein